jgi:hypothetical protein
MRRSLKLWLAAALAAFVAAGSLAWLAAREYTRTVVSIRAPAGPGKLISGAVCLCSEPAINALAAHGYLDPDKRTWHHAILSGATLRSDGFEDILGRVNAFGADLRGARISAADLLRMQHWKTAFVDEDIAWEAKLPLSHNEEVKAFVWGKEHNLGNWDLSCRTMYLLEPEKEYLMDGANLTGTIVVIPEPKYEAKIQNSMKAARWLPGFPPQIKVSAAGTSTSTGSGCHPSSTPVQHPAPESLGRTTGAAR